jgi:hypothetical protein
MKPRSSKIRWKMKTKHAICGHESVMASSRTQHRTECYNTHPLKQITKRKNKQTFFTNLTLLTDDTQTKIPK